MTYRKIFRWTVAILLLAAMLLPDKAQAQSRRRHNNTQTTQTTPATQTTSGSSTNSSSRRRRSSTTNAVTTSTRNAASTASSGKNAAGKPAASTQSGSSKTKITVAKPNLEEIMEVTQNPSSKFYYPKLWKRYEQNDTVMTPEEYRYLYLGYMFQEDYDPYRESKHADYVEEMRNSVDLSKASKAEINKIIENAEKALNDNPFDLRQMSFLVYLLKLSHKDMKAKIWEYRLEHLLGAIKSTGTGDSVENAWFVIYPMHEYDMIQLLGYEAVDVEYINPGYDHLLVKPDSSISHRNPAKGFYFNVVVPQQQYFLKHPEEES